MSSNKKDFMCFKQDGAISELNGKPLNFVNLFIYFGSNISFTVNDVNICIGKAWTDIKLTTMWKSNISDICKRGNTTVWLHHLEFNETPGEKARWELHNDAACYFEQILEATI